MGDRPDSGSKCTRAPAFVLGSCVCTEREVRWSFLLLVVIITLVTISLVLFASAVRYVKAWVGEKQRLRTDVKALSRHASGVMRDAQQRAASAPPASIDPTTTAAVTPPAHPRPRARAPSNTPSAQSTRPPSASAAASKAHMAAIAAADPLVHEMLDAIEAVRLGSCGRGFAFAVDSRGGVWAHGKTRHLARGATGRVPGFHRVVDGDHTGGVAHATGDDEQGDAGTPAYGGAPIAPARRRRGAHSRAPSPLADMLSAARRGGGYVHFRWKREMLMMAYVHPVKGTDLVLGGAVPVPRKQKAWEEANATRPAVPAHR
ncbi:hypothetical protein psal_cds_250 [Pandoravirus salinus]|uniref:Uncharacterized protein n=1 Tax=Pandoravirus salinus TaxID=1349410 RepID=S4W100_9VIRU|nr:DNA pol3 delta2 superfamily incomplete domain [Pandoravirus salinus]AGO83805.1 hypothetical protein psal_cds_250 [Pandoravirus salinus]